MPDPASLSDVRPILESARTIAVLGAHPDPSRPAHYVPAYLASAGYRVLPVNVTKAGTTLFGERVRASLTELGEPVSIVDVFRRGPDVAGHVDEILAMDPRPDVVWLQLGIQNDAAAAALRAAGIAVVQDRCTLADHRALGLR